MKKGSPMKYNLELTETHLELIMKALDFHTRIQMGQLSELTNPYSIPLPNTDFNITDEQIYALKKEMFPELKEKELHSIKSKKLNDTIRQEVDIFEVIRYNLSKSDDKPRPINWSNEQTPPILMKDDTNGTT